MMDWLDEAKVRAGVLAEYYLSDMEAEAGTLNVEAEWFVGEVLKIIKKRQRNARGKE